MTPAVHGATTRRGVRRAGRGPSTGALRDAARFADLLERRRRTAGALPHAAPRPEFVADLRERLMAEADTVLVAADRPRRKPARRRRAAHRRERRLAVAVGGSPSSARRPSMAVAARARCPATRSTRSSAASRTPRPASPRRRRQGRARSSTTPPAASTRSTALSRDGAGERRRPIADTLDDLHRPGHRGLRPAARPTTPTPARELIAELRDFTADSLDRLAALEARRPAERRADELVEAARTRRRIDAAGRGRPARPAATAPTAVPTAASPTAPTLPGAIDAATGSAAGTGRAPEVRPAPGRARHGRHRGRQRPAPGSRCRPADPRRPRPRRSPPAATSAGDPAADGGWAVTDPIGGVTDGLTGDRSGGTGTGAGTGDRRRTVEDATRGLGEHRLRARRAHRPACSTCSAAAEPRHRVSGRRTGAASAACRASAGSSRAPGR